MTIIREARDNVPMNMRHHVAKACQIDLPRRHQFAQYYFRGKYDTHQALALRGFQEGHFTDMVIENYAAESRVVRILYEDDTAECISPHHLATVSVTQFTVIDR